MSVDALSDGLNALAALLSQERNAPDPERDDWIRFALDELYRVANDQVLARLTDALAELDPTNAAEARNAVAHSVSQAAAVLGAAGDDRAVTLLRKAAPLAKGDDFAAAIREGESDPIGFAWLNFAFWSLNNGTERDADRAARRAMKSRSPAIKDFAKAIDARSRELATAPGLGSVNGIGLTVYGSRDPIEDTYVTTRYFIVVFIPIFAIDAFRVRKAPGDGWYFLTKEKLGPIAIWWRRLIVFGLIAAIGYGIFQSTYNSTRSRAQRAIAAAQADADPVAAQRQLFEEFPGHEHRYLTGAATDLVDRMLAEAPKTVTPADAPRVADLIRNFKSLPSQAVNGTSKQALIDKLVEWAGAQDPMQSEQADFADQMLADAIRIDSTRSSEGVGTVRDAQRIAQAGAIAEQWPLDALRLLAQIRDPASARADAEAIVKRLPRDATVWQEVLPTLRTLVNASGAPGVPMEQLKAVTVAARGIKPLSPAQQELITKQAIEPLKAELAKAPHDERLAVGLAQAQATAGQLPAALATLDSLGPRGFLGAQARQMGAQLLVEAGKAGEADDLLTYHLRGRRPAYEIARDRYMNGAKALEDRLIQRARTGQLPDTLERKLRGNSEAQQQKIFSEWLRDRLENDSTLKANREAWLAYQDVVPMALQLGTLKLQRAQGETGAARERLLTQAEQVLLSIQGEAGGTTEYQLQLGQVYFRTGKREKGEAEFDVLLKRKDPELTVQVASAYRFVGEQTRARALLEEVVETASDPIKTGAAVALTAMSESLEDREKWIGKASDLDDKVRTQRMQISAERLLQDGKLAAADKKLAEVVRLLSKNAESSAAAANNAANAESDRYQCTGDIKRMHAAGKLMDRALRLMPDNPVVNANASYLQSVVAELELLTPHLDLGTLRLRGGESTTVLDALLRGPLRAELIAAGRRSPRIRRVMQLSERAFALAPGATNGYSAPMGWAIKLDDAKAMQRLARRAQDAPLDTQAFLSAILANAADPDAEKNTQVRLDALAARRPKSRKDKAVHALLRADMHRDLSRETGAVKAAQTALTEAQRARALWPELVSDNVELAYQLNLGTLQLAASQSALADRVAELRWSSSTGLLWRVAKTSPAVRKAMQKSPALRRAAQLWRRPANPQVSGWMFARLMNDQALLTAHRAAFENALESSLTKALARVQPSPDQLDALAVLKAGPDQAF